MLLDRLCRLRSAGTSDSERSDADPRDSAVGRDGASKPELSVVPGTRPSGSEAPCRVEAGAAFEKELQAEPAGPAPVAVISTERPDQSPTGITPEESSAETAPLHEALAEITTEQTLPVPIPSCESDATRPAVPAVANGRESIPDTAKAEAVVRLYLHPGRALIGEFCMDRLRSQFDLSAADRHPDLSSAETACGDASAFLAEVQGPSDELDCGPTDRVALLIRGLRP